MSDIRISEAHSNFNQLKKASGLAGQSLQQVAKLLYLAKYNKYYKELGYDTLAEYAAQTEIGLSAKTTTELISLFENFCLKGGKIAEQLTSDVANLFSDPSKAYKSIPLLQGSTHEEVIDIVGGNSTADIVSRVREQRHANRITQPLPTDKYNVILSDPPWRYEFSETNTREIENQYPTMELEEIKSIKVPAADDSILFLWATAPKLEEALQVLNAWGFSYKTCAVWDKEKIGMGYWFRGQHELLLIGVKGSFPTPVEGVRQSSVHREKRQGHSVKPQYYYELIESYFPEGKYLELFSRNERKRWQSWGNE